VEYRSVRRRLAVDFSSLNLPISPQEALEILRGNRFSVLEVDILALARQCVETSQYRRGARSSAAPEIVDCSSFVKWLYAQAGIWLPRRSIQQRELGERIEIEHICGGDVVFTSGKIDYYLDDPVDGVGHVGVATCSQSVIHAANSKVGVIETELDKFCGKNKFRGARRYIPRPGGVTVLETPQEREVETVDDIKWIILQSVK
jgi:hypothetical protein